MATFDASKFGPGLTPEKAHSIPRYFINQMTYKPKPVTSPRLEGKTAVVTGGNSGVGLETARQLLDLGVEKLILACRSLERGEAAAKDLTSGSSHDGTVEVWPLEMSSYESITAFASRCRASVPRLDLVVLNAAVGPATQRSVPSTGHEETIQVNYLSTALLALLLLPVVASTPRDSSSSFPPRITFISSEVVAFTRFAERNDGDSILKALDKENPKIDMIDRMMVSKLLGHFFLGELAARVEASKVLLNAVSPGAVSGTGFVREMVSWDVRLVERVKEWTVNGAPDAARIVLDAAVSRGPETHGLFISLGQLKPLAPMVYTDEGRKLSERLWRETMEELAFAKPEDLLKEVGGSI